MADAAVIIPHYNDTARLGRCLEALIPQLTDAVEVVVVDNASTDPVADVQARFADVHFVTETDKGAACARNRGVAETTAPQLFFLDCDCVPAPDWLATALSLRPHDAVIGGQVTLFDETPAPRNGAQAFETVFAFHNRDYIETKGFSVTANLLTSRDVFEATGPFVAGLSEDLDWCHRAQAAGYGLVYAQDLSVAHPTRNDWDALARKWRRLTHEAFGVNGTTPAARTVWAAKAMAMPVSILAHAPRVLRNEALASTAERVAGLGTLARLRLMRCGWMLRQAATGRA